MRLIRDNFDWQEFLMLLDEVGIAGHPYPFDHMNEPDDFPCMCETLIDDDKPGRVQLVHVFFTTKDAEELLDVSVPTSEEPEETNEQQLLDESES